MQNKLYAVDLFAGGGGLTTGLKDAGFAVVGAVELDPAAASTHQSNHPEVKLFIQDIKYIKGRDLLGLTPDGQLDLLAGCPPCQGFSSLTAKYKREDPRNLLVNEMLRLIEESRPYAVMMENVPGLALRGRHLLDPMIEHLQRLGYIVETGVLQVADFGVPQFRRRFVLLAGRGFRISMPNPTHSRDGQSLPKWKTVRDAIEGLPEPFTLSQAKKRMQLPSRSWHIVRDLAPQNISRIKAAKPGKGWKDIPEELRPKCHKGDYNGFSNVYGRMSWDEVSPTITGGCTTLSKGRFGHPEADRTISVREAARLQTFPDDYVFDTPYMEYACKIIGNALPCLFAKILSSHCLSTINSHRYQIVE